MAGLGLTTQAQVLPCPACGQTINTSMTQCPFCAAPVDASAAAASADAFGKLNQAISDASALRIMLGVAVAFYFARFLPFFGIFSFAFLFMEFAIPFMVIRWWVRYRAIQSADPEFVSARKTILWVAAAAVFGILFANLLPYLLLRVMTLPS